MVTIDRWSPCKGIVYMYVCTCTLWLTLGICKFIALNNTYMCMYTQTHTVSRLLQHRLRATHKPRGTITKGYDLLLCCSAQNCNITMFGCSLDGFECSRSTQQREGRPWGDDDSYCSINHLLFRCFLINYIFLFIVIIIIYLFVSFLMLFISCLLFSHIFHHLIC